VLLQQLASGLTAGGVYALIALGFVLIYKSTDVVNFAQGELVTWGAYFGLVTFVALHLPFPLAFLLALAASGALGLVIERVAMRPLLGGPALTSIIATIGVGLVLQNAIRLIWGGDIQPFPPVFDATPRVLGPVRVTAQSAYVLLLAIVLMAAFAAFFRFTRTGTAMRATAQNRPAAALMGVRVERMNTLAWVLGGTLAGAAGVLLAPLIVVAPDMGFVALKAFAAAILGGFSSFAGAIFGGFVLGVVESLAGAYVSTAFKDIVSFAVIIGVLVLRPAGLLQVAHRKKV
jgi:branched-chain amino acid transport system permease protein